MKKTYVNQLTNLYLNPPSQVKVVIIISRKPRWCDETTCKAIAAKTGVCVDIHTTVTTIIVTVCIIGLIVTEPIADQCNITTI